MPAVSVIVPVYNVEKYLSKCLDSIIAQSFIDYECILVDDNSTDDSPALCNEYANRDKRFKVIHNTQNEGSAQARKTGLGIATGTYVLYVDSDDWIEAAMLDTMYKKAISGDFDIVLCDIARELPDHIEYQKHDISGMDKIAILKSVLRGQQFTCSLWDKLVKRGIYLRVHFPSANYGEDKYITTQSAYYAEKITLLNEAFYHYRFNESSLCNNVDHTAKKALENYTNYALIIAFLEDHFDTSLDIFEPELSDSINLAKLPFAINKEIRDRSKIQTLYPESNKHIFRKTLEINILDKVMMFCTLKNIPFPYFVIKTIYRIVLPKQIRTLLWSKRNH